MDYLKTCEWKPKVLRKAGSTEATSRWRQRNSIAALGSEVRNVMSPRSISLVESSATPPNIPPEFDRKQQNRVHSRGQACSGALDEMGRAGTILGLDQQPSNSSISKLRAFAFQPKRTGGIETCSTSVQPDPITNTASTKSVDLDAGFEESVEFANRDIQASDNNYTRILEVEKNNIRSESDYGAEETMLNYYEGAPDAKLGENVHTLECGPGYECHSESPKIALSTPASVQKGRSMVPSEGDLSIPSGHVKTSYVPAEPSSALVELANDLALSTYNQINEQCLITDEEFSFGTPTESDHEFAITDDEEQQLLHLTDIQERFSPPSNLQLPFDDSARSPEIFDSNLKGSPPEASDDCTTNQQASKYFGQSTAGVDTALLDVNRVDSAPTGDQMGCDSYLSDTEWGFLHDTSPHHTHSLSPSPGFNEADANGNPFSTEPAAVSNNPTHELPQPGLKGDDDISRPKPFARAPFPAAVQGRPFIPGLSSSTRLRTCFRIGEALREASMAARCRRQIIIELYARALYSSRENEGFKQVFQFGDLFHDRGPFLTGVCTSWKTSKIWDIDMQAFLGEGGKDKMARVVGRLERNGASWQMDILSIWEASWDDVAHVRGIVCS
ncbi:MAG: hypothetical protein M1816_004522 [Peltula sp. TS41687]|nr:MAG: hypothetical protein M1816_004522 [Peltula sp. TS41687]